MSEILGRVHSFESFGAVDGPGIRFIVFLQGCPLRCLYCHNPDTWDTQGGFEIAVNDMVKKIVTYKNFIQKGGVTLSGGEPLLQAEFCEALIESLHAENLHVAIDTSGAIPLEISEKAISKADLILLDIKDIDKDDCKTLTGQGNDNAKRTLELCERLNISVWIRHVLIPDYTFDIDKLNKLGNFLKNYKCIEKVEILPYHSMGKFKWDELGEKYLLDDILPPTSDEINQAKAILQSYGLNIK